MPFLIQDALAGEAPATGAATDAATVPPYELSPEKMMMDNLLILGLLFFIFYFILIRPQQKRVRMHQEMMKTIQKGQKIMTTGGIIGTVVKLEGEDMLIVEISPNVKVQIAKSAISEIMDPSPAGKNANDN